MMCLTFNITGWISNCHEFSDLYYFIKTGLLNFKHLAMRSDYLPCFLLDSCPAKSIFQQPGHSSALVGSDPIGFEEIPNERCTRSGLA